MRHNVPQVPASSLSRGKNFSSLSSSSHSSLTYSLIFTISRRPLPVEMTVSSLYQSLPLKRRRPLKCLHSLYLQEMISQVSPFPILVHYKITTCNTQSQPPTRPNHSRKLGSIPTRIE